MCIQLTHTKHVLYASLLLCAIAAISDRRGRRLLQQLYFCAAIGNFLSVTISLITLTARISLKHLECYLCNKRIYNQCYRTGHRKKYLRHFLIQFQLSWQSQSSRASFITNAFPLADFTTNTIFYPLKYVTSFSSMAHLKKSYRREKVAVGRSRAFILLLYKASLQLKLFVMTILYPLANIKYRYVFASKTTFHSFHV